MKCFDESVCIVTGAASGIGLAICQELCRTGARVVLADVRLDAAVDAAEELCRQGGDAEAVFLDVTNQSSFEKIVAETVRRYGRLDYLFNNAGLNVLGDFRDLNSADWQRLMDVNLWGVIHGTRAAYAAMTRQGHGHIVNMASGFGLTPAPRNVPYCMTKFAVVGLSESLRIEAADLGVQVSVVCPGWINTPMIAHGKVAGGRIGQTIGTAARLSWFGIADVDKSAKRILRAVARRRPIITFPRYVRLFTLLYHACRPISDLWNLNEIRSFRRKTRAQVPLDDVPLASREPRGESVFEPTSV